MVPVRKIVVGACLAIGVFATLADGSSTVSTKPASGGSSGSSSGGSSSGGSATTAAVAHVGATIDVQDESQHAEAITLVKVFDPATGSDEFTTPDGGKRFVAVQITITNKSTAAVKPNPQFESTLIDSANQSYTADFNAVSDCQAFATSITIAPGESATGCTVYQVPTANTPAKFQYTPSSGFSGSTAQWDIP